jgi:hypothetical protein
MVQTGSISFAFIWRSECIFILPQFFCWKLASFGFFIVIRDCLVGHTRYWAIFIIQVGVLQNGPNSYLTIEQRLWGLPYIKFWEWPRDQRFWHVWFSGSGVWTSFLGHFLFPDGLPVCIHTENQNQGDFYPFVLLEISVGSSFAFFSVWWGTDRHF